MADFLSAILLLTYCRRDCGARRLVFAYVGKKEKKKRSMQVWKLVFLLRAEEGESAKSAGCFYTIMCLAEVHRSETVFFCCC